MKKYYIIVSVSLIVILLTSCNICNNKTRTQKEQVLKQVEIVNKINNSYEEQIRNLEKKIKENQNINKNLFEDNKQLKENEKQYKEEIATLTDKIKNGDNKKEKFPFKIGEEFRGIKLLMSYEEVINILGEPVEHTTYISETEGQTDELVYSDFRLEFIGRLVRILIDKPNIEGIRGISVGDSFEEIINEFPNEGFNLSKQRKDLYSGGNNPIIYYNDKEDIYNVTFIAEWGYWLDFEIKDDIIIEISYNLQTV